ncbi:MAG TPA: response regulator [Polyangiaceae bacterium]|jgi:two-component system copper resistance phosphate regulon response regulator CusR|nr:response regulator [Polyangiaceae bacterium]
MRVLLAAGDPESVRVLGAALRKLQHEVAVAHDGEEALDLYAKEPFPLVIADWQVPRMSGIELCKAIRHGAREWHSYMVLATSLSGDENVLAGFDAGADDYLVKPFSTQDVETRIVAAERVCNGMAKCEVTVRDLVEMCASDSRDRGHTPSDVASGSERRRVYSKARTFLMRQIVQTKHRYGPRPEGLAVARFVHELERLQDLEEELN